VLTGIVKKENLPLLIEMSGSHKSLKILTKTVKPFWYRIGLTLSDGAILDQYRLIFSSSSKFTIEAILYSFSNIIVYPSYYMVNTSNMRSICSYNFIARDPSVAGIVYKIKSNKQYAIETAKYLLNNNEYMIQFLAGIIDGDGTIDKDNIRVSVSSADPVLLILSKIFKDNVSYDSKKFILRISTSEVRKRKLPSRILNYLVSPQKRKRLIQIRKKRQRLDIKLNSLTESKLSMIAHCLNEKEHIIISQFKYRTHGKYTYAYIPANSKNLDSLYGIITDIFLKISDKIGVDITGAIKMGTREVVIYNQDVVSLVRAVQKLIG
jgi:hypothetical protein